MKSALDSFLVSARRFRAFLLGRLHGWTFMIPMGLVVTALALFSDGDVVAGIAASLVALPAIWLGGVWIMPWGVDRYVRQVSGVLQSGSREANSANTARNALLSNLRTMIKEFDPPADHIGTHQEIVNRMREMDCLEADSSSESLVNRTMQINAIRSDLLSVRERLSSCGSDSRASQLARLLGRLLQDEAETRRTTEAALKEMRGRLEKMRVPREWQDKHSRCESVLSTYLASLKRFNDACESENSEAIWGAAQELSVDHVTMEKLITEYVDDLRGRYLGRMSRLA